MGFKFGDVLQNGWTSEDNPYYESIFLRKTKQYIHVMEFDGTLGEYFNDNKHRLVKVGSIINDDVMNRFIEDMRRKKREWIARK